MLTFKGSNPVGPPCPVCGTKEDKPIALLSIQGTGDGLICEGMQVHLDCLDLTAITSKEHPDVMFFVQQVNVKR